MSEVETLLKDQEAINITTISPIEVLRRLKRKEKPNLLDVRTPEEYSWGHIPGAILLPLPDIQKGRIDLDIKPYDEIIVFCQGGYRSFIATKILYQMGYRNIKDMQEGMMGWEDINGPIET